MSRHQAFLAAIASGTFLLAACSGDGTTGPNPGPGGGEDVSLSISVPTSGGNFSVGAGSPVHFDLVFDQGGDNLTITRVAMVLREVELKKQEEDQCEDSSGGTDNDDCEEFEVGPFLLELPMDGSVETLVTLDDVDPGVYDELEFDIHKPEDDGGEDMAFLQENPDFRDVSIRVEGTFNGEPFVFLTDLNEEQEVDLVPPLIVGETPNTTNVTLVLDVGTWFLAPGNSLIDPATANKGGENENLVRDNIRNSIEGFEDEDKDGEHDD
ncbi:MAG: hypothetical protein ACE5HP_06515 [Gemmatimonadota bacterium]